jgi:hypothetical protein
MIFTPLWRAVLDPEFAYFSDSICWFPWLFRAPEVGWTSFWPAFEQSGPLLRKPFAVKGRPIYRLSCVAHTTPKEEELTAS